MGNKIHRKSLLKKNDSQAIDYRVLRAVGGLHPALPGDLLDAPHAKDGLHSAAERYPSNFY